MQKNRAIKPPGKDSPIRKRTKYINVFTTAVGITSFVLFVIWFAKWTFVAAFYPFDDLKFEQSIWLKHPNEEFENPRGQMVEDLMANHLVKGIAKEKVKQLLGQPFRTESGGMFGDFLPQSVKLIWIYPIGSWSGFQIDSDFLSVAFDKDGTLVKAWRWQS